MSTAIRLKNLMGRSAIQSTPSFRSSIRSGTVVRNTEAGCYISCQHPRAAGVKIQVGIRDSGSDQLYQIGIWRTIVDEPVDIGDLSRCTHINAYSSKACSDKSIVGTTYLSPAQVGNEIQSVDNTRGHYRRYPLGHILQSLRERIRRIGITA